MDSAAMRFVPARHVPIRLLVLLAILLLVAVTAVLVVGARNRAPDPFGLARNGQIAYVSDGDLWVRDSLTGRARLLVGGDGAQQNPSYSPDGRWLAYVATAGGADRFMVARSDGSEPRLMTVIPATGNAQAAWRPDSRAIAFIFDERGGPRLSVATIDGGPAQALDLGRLKPIDVSWRPPDGAQLLVRAERPDGTVDLVLVNADGSGMHPLNLTSRLVMGPSWENSGPAWDPAGTRIAYNSVEPATTGPWSGVFRVRMVSPDGVAGPDVPSPADRAVDEAWPSYSPDGRWILVHRWTPIGSDRPEGWLAVMPADGSAAAHDIGPRIPGGEDTGLEKAWSPDATRVLMAADNTHEVFSIDPASGESELLDWTGVLPDWQRTAP
jgi:Tol biopolymer transport system component